MYGLSDLVRLSNWGRRLDLRHPEFAGVASTVNADEHLTVGMRNYLKQQRAACLREAGQTWRAIADTLGVSAHRAQQLAGYGQGLGQPDEIIFPRFLKAETPIRYLPVSKLTRDRLAEAGVQTCGELLTDGFPALRRNLLRYPNFGRAKITELDDVVEVWRSLSIASTKASRP